MRAAKPRRPTPPEPAAPRCTGPTPTPRCGRPWACPSTTDRRNALWQMQSNWLKSYVPKLDEVYKLASLTAMLDGASDLARQGANANELIMPHDDDGRPGRLQPQQRLCAGRCDPEKSRQSSATSTAAACSGSIHDDWRRRHRLAAAWRRSSSARRSARRSTPSGLRPTAPRPASARRRRPWPMARPWLLRCAPPPPPWMRMRSRKATGTCTSRLRCTA